ncbi:MAG: hypothetical protein FWD83_01890 [Promicromonosporaceae bacterium]|nr:hypothetical protein [Promicromonosporaceae bacterium]
MASTNRDPNEPTPDAAASRHPASGTPSRQPERGVPSRHPVGDTPPRHPARSDEGAKSPDPENTLSNVTAGGITGGRDLRDSEIDVMFAGITKGLGDLDVPVVEAPHPPAERPRGPRDWPTSQEVEALEEAEGWFTPSDPGRQVRDRLSLFAWLMAVGTPILTLVLLTLARLIPALHLPGWLGPLGGVIFLTGLALLFTRMPTRRDPDNTDSGAVV